MLIETETTTEIKRIEKPRPRFPLMDEMWVERGSKADWDLLHDLHYKAENLPSGPRFWRLALNGDTIGVLVTSRPKGLLKERHDVFPSLKPGGNETPLTNQLRFKWINGNIRVISRFVLDTMYRGIGAGYRFQNLASRMEGFRFIEIQSSMSKFNTFGQKAGFKFAQPRNSNKYEVGLKFFRSHFSSNPQDYEAIIAEIDDLPEKTRERMLSGVRQFYLQHSALEKTGGGRHNRVERVAGMSTPALIKALQQLVLASPLYGVWKSPDLGRQLPERMPLAAFECQGVNEPLRWQP